MVVITNNKLVNNLVISYRIGQRGSATRAVTDAGSDERWSLGLAPFFVGLLIIFGLKR